MKQIMSLCLIVLMFTVAVSGIYAQTDKRKIAETHLGVKDESAKKEESESSSTIIRFELFKINVITELPETFLIKTSGKIPQIDAEKLYSNLYSIDLGVLNITEWKLFVEAGKKGVLDTRKVIPGTDEKEGLYFEVKPEITKDGKVGSQIEILITKFVEWKTVVDEGQKSKQIPIMSLQEMSSYTKLTPDKPAIMYGASPVPIFGNLETFVPKTFTMIKASIYVKPKASIEF